MGFAGTKLVISPPEVFIYLPKSKNPGSFLFFPEGEFVYIREKNFFSLSHKGRMGWGTAVPLPHKLSRFLGFFIYSTDPS